MTTTVEKCYQSIRKSILCGDYPEGMWLKEDHLALELNVSRTPVREALRRLAVEGLTSVNPNHGTRVATWPAEAVRESFELRSYVESYCTSLAARKMTPEILARLTAIADEMENLSKDPHAADLGRLAELNNSFHINILQAADNAHLSAFLPGLIDMTVALKTYSHYTGIELQRTNYQHRELIAAFTRHDENWAGAIMKSHLLAARNKYLQD